MALLDPRTRIAMLEGELQSAHHQLRWAHLTIEKREAQIRALEERLRQRRIELLGPYSETLSDLQLELLAEEEPSATREEVKAEAGREPLGPKQERKPHPGRRPLPENLPRVESVIACADQNCGRCGAATSIIGYDESEQLDHEPARWFVRVVKREKRACVACSRQGGSTITMPELEPRIVEKGLASDAVVIGTVIAKYCDHLPLYRQQAILEREAGEEISRATLDGWVR